MIALAQLAEPQQPSFPGAVLAVAGDGTILRSWLGPASPFDRASGDVVALLGLDDAGTEAARIQMFLASSCNSMVAAWSMLVSEAPVVLAYRGGERLRLAWSPIAEGGRVTAVALFILAGTPAVIELDPAERNRVCVDALALLDESDGCLRHLRVDAGARHSVHRMFRAIHTIKGSTRGMRSVSELAHQVEDVLDLLRRNDGGIEVAVLDQVELDLRRLRTEVIAARPHNEVDDALTELVTDARTPLDDLRNALARMATGELAAVAAARRAIDRLGAAADRAAMRALRLQCTAAHNALEMVADGAGLDAELIAEAAALEPQLDLYRAMYREITASDAGPSLLATLGSWLDAPDDAGEISELAAVLASAGVGSFASSLADPSPFAIRRALAAVADARAMFEPARPRDDASVRFERAQRDLLDALDRLARQTPVSQLAEIRAIVQRLVWVPMAVIARRLVRMARALGSELGKQVVAEIDFGDLLVAPEIGRIVGEILVHAVRNSADHGIESPAERIAAGKDPGGTIRVHARQHRDRLLVVVHDDGRGVDLDRVRAIAIRQGLIRTASDAATDAEAIELLFMPGFSTTSSISAVSGRGVGMDVIRCLAEEQGGSATLRSVHGHGTELRIDLPLAPA